MFCCVPGKKRPKSEFLGGGEHDPGLLPFPGSEFYPRPFFFLSFL